MSFLAPLFLLGGLAIGLPILLHLIRRSSKEQIPFSSLMFLAPSLPRVAKRSKLEHILLLLLHCLVVCLLAFAFARPFIQRATTAPLAAETLHKIVILIDASASMRRDGIWPAALAKAQGVLKSVAPNDKVALYTFDRQIHAIVPFGQWSQLPASERIPFTQSRLSELKPGWSGTQLGSALTSAAETFAEADEQGQNQGSRRLVLISDLEEGDRLDGLQGYDWPHGLEVQIEPVQAKHPTNAGLRSISEPEATPTAEKDVGPRVSVSNSSTARREQFQLKWGSIAAATALEVYVPPGQTRTVRVPAPPAGTIRDRLVLVGDDDDFDNTLFLVQRDPEQVRVLFLGAEAAKDTTQPLYYLGHAFQQTRQQAIKLEVHASTTPPTDKDLAAARLLVATDPLPDNLIEPIRGNLAAGGTLLLAMKSPDSAVTIGRLAGVTGISATEAAATNYAMLARIDFTHPLFAPFADPRYSDFTKIHFWKHRHLETGSLTGMRTLAAFDNGDLALGELPIGKGRLLILTSGWHPSDSQLALSSKFVPILYAMLESGSGSHPPLAQFQVGDPVGLAGVAASGSGQPLTVLKPDATRVVLTAGETSFAQTDLPGIYEVVSTQPALRFAVNVDPAESRTTPVPIEEFERLKVPLKASLVEVSRQAEHSRHIQNSELENRQKLWRTLTLAALLILLIETWLAGWMARRASFQLEGAS